MVAAARAGSGAADRHAFFCPVARNCDRREGSRWNRQSPEASAVFFKSCPATPMTRNARHLKRPVIGVPQPQWDERPLPVEGLRSGQAPDKRGILAALLGKIAKWW